MLSLQTVLYVFTGVLATAKSVWKAVVTDSFVYLYRILLVNFSRLLAVVTDSFVYLYRQSEDNLHTTRAVVTDSFVCLYRRPATS